MYILAGKRGPSPIVIETLQPASATNPEGGKDMGSNPLSGEIKFLNTTSPKTRLTTEGIYGMPDFSRVTA